MEKTKFLFIRFYKLDNSRKFVVQEMDDLEFAKNSCDYCKRKHNEDCILLNEQGEKIYDTRPPH